MEKPKSILPCKWSDDKRAEKLLLHNNPSKQYSTLLFVQIPTYLLGGIIIKASFAADMGDLYPKTNGVSV